MTYTPTTLLTVFLDQGKRRKAGRLAIRDRQILFEYDPLSSTPPSRSPRSNCP